MKNLIIAAAIGVGLVFAWKRWGKADPCGDPKKPCAQSSQPNAAEQKQIGAGIEAGITTPEGGSTQPVVPRTAPEALRTDGQNSAGSGAYATGLETNLEFMRQGGE